MTNSAQGQTTDEGQGRIFPCEQCGADLEFNIGVQQMKCPFCGAVKEIELGEDAVIEEQDFREAIAKQRELHEQNHDIEEPEHKEIRCESCSSNVIFTGTLTSTSCPYCGSPIQRENVHSGGFRIAVDAVLPFRVEHDEAQDLLGKWVQSRWFAPNDFKKKGINGEFNGVYLPFWTYDSLTFNKYSGQRGENYTVTVGTGKNRRTETRTRWYSASGRFQRFFNDELINATTGLPTALIDALTPWPLSECLPFTQQVLAGYYARTYDLELDEGFVIARERIDQKLYADVCSRIGGDKQRVHDIDTRYDAITFKHLLLPVWMLAYRYKDKTFRIYVNAGTGEVQGERPWSWVKICLTILAVMSVVAMIAIIGANS